MHHLAENPTSVQIIVSEYINYLKYTDSCILVAGGVNYIRTPDHTTLCMEICMDAGDSRLTSVSQKSKRYIDNKRSRTSGISSGVTGAGICGGGSEF